MTIPSTSIPTTGARRAVALADTLAAVASMLGLLAILAPSLDRTPPAPIVHSMKNLRTLLGALECYAADWDGRQFTAVPDDLGVAGGSCEEYYQQFGCYSPMVAGWSCEGPLYGLYSVWTPCDGFVSGGGCTGAVLTLPLHLDPALPRGVFRIPQTKGIHDYVAGRFHDPTFYLPQDRKAYAAVQPFLGEECEFVAEAGTVPSSYALSPAAMYHPEVFRAPSQGGFQHPDTLADGYESPAVAQARFPQLKTWLIEHNWLHDPPGDCNPAYEDPFGFFSDACDPYLFNHGADAAPVALFFDGSIAQLRTGDVVEDDARVLKQTGGVDGLWSRDTPFGETGYFGDASFDGTVVSHHILTTGGILGRDTLRRPSPAPGTGDTSR